MLSEAAARMPRARSSDGDGISRPSIERQCGMHPEQPWPKTMTASCAPIAEKTGCSSARFVNGASDRHATTASGPKHAVQRRANGNARRSASRKKSIQASDLAASAWQARRNLQNNRHATGSANLFAASNNPSGRSKERDVFTIRTFTGTICTAYRDIGTKP